MHSCCSHKFPKHIFCGASSSKAHWNTPINFPPAPHPLCFWQISKTTPGTLYLLFPCLEASYFSHRPTAPSHFFSLPTPMFISYPPDRPNSLPAPFLCTVGLPSLSVHCISTRPHSASGVSTIQNSLFSLHLYLLPPLCTFLGNQRIHHQGEKKRTVKEHLTRALTD